MKASNNIRAEMDKLARELPEYDVIKEIPGCGEKLTSRIIAEIGDIRSCSDKSKIKIYILKKETEGKIKKVAKIAGMNKFLRIYYGTVKRKYKELNIWI